MPWASAWERIDVDFDGHLEEIRRFLRRPTVSASDDDMLAGAEDVAALIEGAGGTAEIVPTAGHPAVLGRIEGDGPRLLRYGMYDVQPADEPDWSSHSLRRRQDRRVRRGPEHRGARRGQLQRRAVLLPAGASLGAAGLGPAGRDLSFSWTARRSLVAPTCQR